MKMIFTSLLFSLTSFGALANTQIFGYVEGYLEKVEKSPTRTGGTSTSEGAVSRAENAHEFDTPNVNIMVKSTKGKYSSFLNLDASNGVDMRNAWVEAKLKNELLKFRIGKLYRKFGLYNERLDAVPTYIGIEPPELFDTDHLLVTRTTNLMFHGQKDLGEGTFYYSLATGNDERAGSEIPLGGDFRYTFFGDSYELTIGSSFYLSHKAKPSVEVGTGSPNGGVLNWMKEDKYEVFGLFTELKGERLRLQLAYFQADHDAIRDGSELKKFDTSALNDEQIQRLCNGDMSSCSDSVVNYKVKTWYVRAGYSFATSLGEFVPYIQWDFYENPETVATKKNGGDNEAGIADDGKFNKQTVGLVFRPDSSLAFKLDASNHSQKIDGESTNYSEVRGSFSYIWQML